MRPARELKRGLSYDSKARRALQTHSSRHKKPGTTRDTHHSKQSKPSHNNTDEPQTHVSHAHETTTAPCPAYLLPFFPTLSLSLFPLHSSQYHVPAGVFSSPTHPRWNHSSWQLSPSHPIISPKEGRWQ